MMFTGTSFSHYELSACRHFESYGHSGCVDPSMKSLCDISKSGDALSGTLTNFQFAQ